MSFKCQIFSKKLTFNRVCIKNNCDVRIIIVLGVLSAILLPIIKCAKLENPQIRLLINDDELLQEKSNLHEAAAAAAAAAAVAGSPDSGNSQQHSGEHFNLYRSELKRLSYETIHRILRDENEPSYRREDTELRYYQKRSPSYEETHQLIKRSALQQQQQHQDKEIVINLQQRNLTNLNTSCSSLSFIIKQLKYASVLDLSDNYLTHFNISCLNSSSSLKTLNLKNNSFNFIPLSKETILRSLNLNHNFIRSSNLTANVYLRNLYLSSNQIEQLSSIDFSLLKNLESLDISHNLLSNSGTSFFTQRMHNLKHLNLAFNRLGSIYRETFYNLLSLNTLLLSHNNITDIDYETFLALPNLQYLDLSFNGLRGKSIRALQGITGLVALNIAFNPDIGPYMQEFVASWSLKELDASGTGLCQIPAALAQSVRSLKLTHNWLKIINCGDLDSYPLLQYLDLSFSHIEHIEDDALGRLEILEILMLDHNLLRKVPVSLPVSLEHLFLQNNDIMEITQQAFQGLTNLKTLDLSHNKLLYLPDISLPKLQTLNLQSSQIRGISQGIIHSLPRLNDLMLEDNPIKCADLLGIAEWASTCRLRGEKGEEQQEDEAEQNNFVLKIQNLKNKYERMHNFYEQFDYNATYSVALKDLKAPQCAQENVKSETNFFKKQKEKLFEYAKTSTTTSTTTTIATEILPVKSLEVAFSRNTSTKTSPNMTEVVVEAVAKRSKEMEQLENVQQQKSTMKTFQTTSNKIKKWIKQETKTTSLVNRTENKTEDVIATATSAPAIAIVSPTTLATPATSTLNPSFTTTAAATSAVLSTTTMTTAGEKQESFIQSQRKDFERGVAEEQDGTTSKLLDINPAKEKQQQEQQQHEIKTKIATTQEIKSLETTLNPKSMQTKQTIKPTTKQDYKPTTIALQMPIEIAGNLEIDHLDGATTTTTSISTKEDNKDSTTFKTTAAFLNKAQTIEETQTAPTTTAQTLLDNRKDLQSNYHHMENNRQIDVKTLNESKIITDTQQKHATTLTSNQSHNNKNHKNAKIFANSTTTATTISETTTLPAADAMAETTSLDNQQQLLLKAVEKDANVKCMSQSNSTNECNNPQQHQQQQQPQEEDKPGRVPTIESTLEQTTAIKTSTEIPTIANMAAMTTATAIPSTPVLVIHKHEPLQLLVKDRHLIGTPLLMHKGDNLMVTADELSQTTNNISNSNSSNNNNTNNHNGIQDVNDNRQHDFQEEIQTTKVTDNNNNEIYLETSQMRTTTTKTYTTTTTTTLETPLTTAAANIRKQEQNSKQPADPVVDLKDFGKWKKSPQELKTKKPSLIMKKMTIITKQHEQQPYDMQHLPQQMAAVQPLENEVHDKLFDNSHYQELKPAVQSSLKHSTVNTAISSNSKRQAANLMKEPQTFQHEHELLIQQILQDQQAESHEKLIKTEQWSDLRKAESKENHPGLILLVSSGLFLVLLLGLMHVYRCDMPWRRHSPTHHLRPHQRQNHSVEDDSHSFLSYSDGMQKWHHSTRLEAPYNSPLHNLHVRELQKTSACEKPDTVKSSASNFKPPPLSRAIMLNNNQTLSQSSTTTTSTASPSSSAILDDESFYIEMTPDSGQLAQALQSELLPMELLNMRQLPTTDYNEAAIADSHTFLEEDSIKHYQQQHHPVNHQLQQSTHIVQLSALSSPAALVSSTADTTSYVPTCSSTTSMNLKPQSQTRKFGLW